MDERLKKTERLMKIWLLLYNNPYRFIVKDIAERCSVSARTVYRDLSAMEEELKIPLSNSDDGHRWGIQEDYHLPPIRFSVPEALSIFLAVRLMLQYSHQYDPNVEMTFLKLSLVLPETLKEQIQKTLEWMRRLTKDDQYLRVLLDLARAWVEQRRCIITYRAYEAERPLERKIEPYFIEPAATGHASYVIAYCHYAGAIRVFRIGRIEKIYVTGETYTIPTDFNANRFFSPAWGIIVEGEEQIVKLKFSPVVARLIEETVWHPSQELEKERDGSLIMTLRVMNTIELVRWIMSWGKDVEVLEPQDLRNGVISAIKEAVKVYSER